MAEITICDNQLTSLNGQVVVLTGCSSGIGLATTQLLLRLGASVVAGDINPAPITNPSLAFMTVDVSSWTDLSSLFKKAVEVHGRIDHVFANAGIPPRPVYLEPRLDASGDLLEPDHRVIEISLKSVVNTTALALHYFRKQDPAGGSIVLTASASSFQRYRTVDYNKAFKKLNPIKATAKHGVLGLMRSLISWLASTTTTTTQQPPSSSSSPQNSIRVNAIAPSYTATGMVPRAIVEATGTKVQEPSDVARSVALLMADGARDGQLMYSWAGRFAEIEEGVLLKGVGAWFAEEGMGRRGEEEIMDDIVAQLVKGHQQGDEEGSS